MNKTIKEIQLKLELLKKIYGYWEIKLIELAKELKVSKTDLMQFVLDHPKLFKGREVTGKNYKALGYHIEQVYLEAKDNPETEEWLQYQKEINQKTLFVKEYDNYGYISGYYLPIDSPEEKIGQYRNTKEKIESIAKALRLKPASYMIGGFGDSSKITPWGFEISIDQINKLKLKGYIFNEFKPLSS